MPETHNALLRRLMQLQEQFADLGADLVARRLGKASRRALKLARQLDDYSTALGEVALMRRGKA